MSTANPLMSGFLGSLWNERMRLVASGLGALLLWFLIGQQVETTDTIALEVRCIGASDPMPVGNGLFIRIPREMAFSAVSPTTIELDVTGTREDLARMEGALLGTYLVPSDFLGGQKLETRELSVGTDGPFQFPRLRSLRTVQVSAEQSIHLTLARRHAEHLNLGAANLLFADESMAKDLDIVFEPALVQISGPSDRATLLRSNPGLFRLVEIDAERFELALRGNLVVHTRGAQFVDPEQRLQTLTVDDQLIKIKFTRNRFRTVVLKDIEVVPHIPRNAWRDENMDRVDPVTLAPDTVEVTLTIPEDAFSAGLDEAQLGKQVRLFVDLIEMPFDSAAGKLPVHVEGLPAGTTIVIDGKKIGEMVIDVEWNTPEAPAESNNEGS